MAISNSGATGTGALGRGGGIFASNVAVSNSTIVLNRASNGSGLLLTSTFFTPGIFTLNNTIVAGNTNFAGTAANDIAGTLNGGSNNLVGTGGSGGLTDDTKRGLPRIVGGTLDIGSFEVQ